MVRLNENLILLADSYKASTHIQYAPNTTKIYSYFESSGGKFNETIFFGLQYFIKRYLAGPVITKIKIDEAEEFMKLHFGTDSFFNRSGWEYIVEKHYGFLPIEIKAVPEGTVVETQNVLFTIENTDPECFWLVNYLETLLAQMWYPITVATNSRAQKEAIKSGLEATGSPTEALAFKLADFGVRGTTCMEQAALGGAAHLINFFSTDNMPAVMFCRQYYGVEMAGYSVPAGEHSTITAWGREKENKALRSMLEQFPNGCIAAIADSYDAFSACSEILGTELKYLIVEREENPGTLLIRTDSGDPSVILVKLLEILTNKFGYEETSTGHKLLPSCVRLIQGHGIALSMLQNLMKTVSKAGYAIENLTFGSGGALLQKMDQDTQKFEGFQCSFAKVDGEEIEVYKDPITDPSKQSRRGKLTLEKKDGRFVTVEHGEGKSEDDQLITVFHNGILRIDQSLDDIRGRAEL